MRAGGRRGFSRRFSPQHIETEQRGADGSRVVTCPGELEAALTGLGERFCSGGFSNHIEPGCSQLGHSSSQHHELWIEQVQRVGESDSQCHCRLVHRAVQTRMTRADLVHQGDARLESVLDSRT